MEFGSSVFAGTVGSGGSYAAGVAGDVGIMVTVVPPLEFGLVAEGDAVHASETDIATIIRPIQKCMHRF